MDSVVSWVTTRDKDTVLSLAGVYAQHLDPQVAAEGRQVDAALRAVWQSDSRQVSSLYLVARQMIRPWQEPAVQDSAVGGASVDLDWLLGTTPTAQGADRARPGTPGGGWVPDLSAYGAAAGPGSGAGWLPDLSAYEPGGRASAGAEPASPGFDAAPGEPVGRLGAGSAASEPGDVGSDGVVSEPDGPVEPRRGAGRSEPHGVADAGVTRSGRWLDDADPATWTVWPADAWPGGAAWDTATRYGSGPADGEPSLDEPAPSRRPGAHADSPASRGTWPEAGPDADAGREDGGWRDDGTAAGSWPAGEAGGGEAGWGAEPRPARLAGRRQRPDGEAGVEPPAGARAVAKPSRRRRRRRGLEIAAPTAARANSLYLCADLDDAERLAPVLGGLLDELLRDVYARVGRTGKPLDPPLLVVIDEAGNWPMRSLPGRISTCAGMGVVLLLLYQSKAQIDAAYGPRADIVVSNAPTKVFFSGLSDRSSLDYAASLVGQEHVAARSVSSDSSPGGGRAGVSDAPTRLELVPAPLLRQVAPGEALLVHRTVPPVHLRGRYWFRDPGLRRLAAGEPPPPSRRQWLQARAVGAWRAATARGRRRAAGGSSAPREPRVKPRRTAGDRRRGEGRS
jgi:hypothetical protein